MTLSTDECGSITPSAALPSRHKRGLAIRSKALPPGVSRSRWNNWGVHGRNPRGQGTLETASHTGGHSVIVQLGMNLVLGSLRSPRTSAWGRSAMIVGLLTALLSTAAFAEPAAQAVPSATPTASAAASCVTTPAQGVVLIVENPNPGDVLTPGSNVVIQGIAYDPTAASGIGVDRVSGYLGDRDTGGIFWG